MDTATSLCQKIKRFLAIFCFSLRGLMEKKELLQVCQVSAEILGSHQEQLTHNLILHLLNTNWFSAIQQIEGEKGKVHPHSFFFTECC